MRLVVLRRPERSRNIRGRGGRLAPATSEREIRKSGSKPPFPTSKILRSLVSLNSLELRRSDSIALGSCKRILVAVIAKNIRGREGWLAPGWLHTRERGQALSLTKPKNPSEGSQTV